jgi:hypothetical protein
MYIIVNKHQVLLLLTFILGFKTILVYLWFS